MSIFYILVMDKNNQDPETWYVTEQNSDEAALKRLTSYNDNLVSSLPKARYPGVPVSDSELRLTNSHTGAMEVGHIYEIQEIS